MARRNTPPRGSGTAAYGSGVRPPNRADQPDLADRGRPTVQEMSALEVVVAMERAREAQRAQPTRKEARVAEPIRPEAPEEEIGPVPLRAQPLPPLPPTGTMPKVDARYLAEAPLPRSVALDDPSLSERPTVRAPFPEEEGSPRAPQPARSLVLSGGPRELASLPEVADQGGVRALPQKLGAEADLRLVMQREPDSPRAAAFRVLRYRIEQLDPDHLVTRVIAVCAPRPGQGATTAAANLALALSECDRARVCLLEGNLRRPALAQLFRFKPPMCFAERLARDRDEPLQPWCVAELLPSLHALAVRESAGRRPLVNGPAFAAAVEAMRRAGYRYVIVDGPEVLGIADMNLIEESVDDVLLVAQGGTTTGGELRAAAAQLSGRKLRGVVLLDSE